MDEYIKRESAIKYLLNDSPGQVSYSREDAADCIRYMDAADVAPVRHGQWEWFEEWCPGTPDHPRECEDSGWRCGKCKTALEDVVYGLWDDPDEEPKLKFCPNCGCCMDGGDPT